MPERTFPTVEQTDLIIQTYSASQLRTLMDTDVTPHPGSTVEFDTGTTVTFQGSLVRPGEPGPDAHLFAIDRGTTGDGEAITRWLTERLEDELFVSVESRHGFVELGTNDLKTAFDESVAAD